MVYKFAREYCEESRYDEAALRGEVGQRSLKTSCWLLVSSQIRSRKWVKQKFDRSVTVRSNGTSVFVSNKSAEGGWACDPLLIFSADPWVTLGEVG